MDDAAMCEHSPNHVGGVSTVIAPDGRLLRATDPNLLVPFVRWVLEQHERARQARTPAQMIKEVR